MEGTLLELPRLVIQKTFPDTECYLINWLGGSGGGFLTCIVYSLLYDQPFDIDLTEYGRAHNNISKMDCNWESTSRTSYFNNLHNVPIYEIIEPKDTGNVTLLYDHQEPDLERLFFIYPRCKVISITLDKDLRPIVYGNLFLKGDNQDLFKQAKVVKPELFRTYSIPYDVPTDIFESFMTEASTCISLPDIYNHDIQVEDKYKNKVFKIYYKDFLNKPKYILSLLNDITGRTVNDDFMGIYESYIQKQDWILKTKMPNYVDIMKTGV